MKNNEILSQKSKIKLSEAYINLYDAFVAAYESNGVTSEQSQYNACCRMYEIISAHESTDFKPAIKFLRKFHNSRYSTTAKKIMEPVQADDETKPTNLAIITTDTILDAINDLENAIAMTLPSILCILKKPTNAMRSLVKPTQKSKQNFSEWLKDTDIDKIRQDPRYFGVLYHQYVMRQGYK
ncbi:MAG: hypothetical protein J6Y07_01165 [Alphaproteobacteria bacterium]|nr:hypothetical protein [Alphaproteobacteria bacterium]